MIDEELPARPGRVDPGFAGPSAREWTHSPTSPMCAVQTVRYDEDRPPLHAGARYPSAVVPPAAEHCQQPSGKHPSPRRQTTQQVRTVG